MTKVASASGGGTAKSAPVPAKPKPQENKPKKPAKPPAPTPAPTSGTQGTHKSGGGSSNTGAKPTPAPKPSVAPPAPKATPSTPLATKPPEPVRPPKPNQQPTGGVANPIPPKSNTNNPGATANKPVTPATPAPTPTPTAGPTPAPPPPAGDVPNNSTKPGTPTPTPAPSPTAPPPDTSTRKALRPNPKPDPEAEAKPFVDVSKETKKIDDEVVQLEKTRTDQKKVRERIESAGKQEGKILNNAVKNLKPQDLNKLRSLYTDMQHAKGKDKDNLSIKLSTTLEGMLPKSTKKELENIRNAGAKALTDLKGAQLGEEMRKKRAATVGLIDTDRKIQAAGDYTQAVNDTRQFVADQHLAKAAGEIGKVLDRSLSADDKKKLAAPAKELNQAVTAAQKNPKDAKAVTRAREAQQNYDKQVRATLSPKELKQFEAANRKLNTVAWAKQTIGEEAATERRYFGAQENKGKLTPTQLKLAEQEYNKTQHDRQTRNEAILADKAYKGGDKTAYDKLQHSLLAGKGLETDIQITKAQIEKEGVENKLKNESLKRDPLPPENLLPKQPPTLAAAKDIAPLTPKQELSILDTKIKGLQDTRAQIDQALAPQLQPQEKKVERSFWEAALEVGLPALQVAGGLLAGVTLGWTGAGAVLAGAMIADGAVRLGHAISDVANKTRTAAPISAGLQAMGMSEDWANRLDTGISLATSLPGAGLALFKGAALAIKGANIFVKTGAAFSAFETVDQVGHTLAYVGLGKSPETWTFQALKGVLGDDVKAQYADLGLGFIGGGGRTKADPKLALPHKASEARALPPKGIDFPASNNRAAVPAAKPLAFTPPKTALAPSSTIGQHAKSGLAALAPGANKGSGSVQNVVPFKAKEHAGVSIKARTPQTEPDTHIVSKQTDAGSQPDSSPARSHGAGDEPNVSQSAGKNGDATDSQGQPDGDRNITPKTPHGEETTANHPPEQWGPAVITPWNSSNKGGIRVWPLETNETPPKATGGLPPSGGGRPPSKAGLSSPDDDGLPSHQKELPASSGDDPATTRVVADETSDPPDIGIDVTKETAAPNSLDLSTPANISPAGLRVHTNEHSDPPARVENASTELSQTAKGHDPDPVTVSSQPSPEAPHPVAAGSDVARTDSPFEVTVHDKESRRSKSARSIQKRVDARTATSALGRTLNKVRDRPSRREKVDADFKKLDDLSAQLYGVSTPESRQQVSNLLKTGSLLVFNAADAGENARPVAIAKVTQDWNGKLGHGQLAHKSREQPQPHTALIEYVTGDREVALREAQQYVKENMPNQTPAIRESVFELQQSVVTADGRISPQAAAEHAKNAGLLVANKPVDDSPMTQSLAHAFAEAGVAGRLMQDPPDPKLRTRFVVADTTPDQAINGNGPSLRAGGSNTFSTFKEAEAYAKSRGGEGSWIYRADGGGRDVHSNSIEGAVYIGTRKSKSPPVAVLNPARRGLGEPIRNVSFDAEHWPLAAEQLQAGEVLGNRRLFAYTVTDARLGEALKNGSQVSIPPEAIGTHGTITGSMGDPLSMHVAPGTQVILSPLSPRQMKKAGGLQRVMNTSERSTADGSYKLTLPYSGNAHWVQRAAPWVAIGASTAAGGAFGLNVNFSLSTFSKPRTGYTELRNHHVRKALQEVLDTAMKGDPDGALAKADVFLERKQGKWGLSPHAKTDGAQWKQDLKRVAEAEQKAMRMKDKSSAEYKRLIAERDRAAKDVQKFKPKANWRSTLVGSATAATGAGFHAASLFAGVKTGGWDGGIQAAASTYALAAQLYQSHVQGKHEYQIYDPRIMKPVSTSRADKINHSANLSSAAANFAIAGINLLVKREPEKAFFGAMQGAGEFLMFVHSRRPLPNKVVGFAVGLMIGGAIGKSSH